MPSPEPRPALGFCTITGRHDKNPEFTEGDFDELYRHLQSHVRLIPETLPELEGMTSDQMGTAKNGPAVILASFKRAGVRADGEVEYTTGCGIDVDKAHVTEAELLAALEGVSAIIYESLRSTPTARRWRVFIEYAFPFSPEQHRAAHKHWSQRLRGADPASSNPSRLWYAVQQAKDAPQRLLRRLKGTPMAPVSRPTVDRRAAVFDNIQPDPRAPAVDGERNATLSRFALSVIGECGSELDLLERLLEQNATYSPPLEDRECAAMARAKWLKFGKVPTDAYEVPTDPGTLGDDLADLFMLDAGQVPWLVQDTITHGAHLLVGRPKGGKSWLAMDLAYAVAAGGTFLGRPTRSAGVLWIAAEDTREGLARRLKVRGEMPAKGNAIVMTMESLKAERERVPEEVGFQQWLREFLDAHPAIELVILDTQDTINAVWAGDAIGDKFNPVGQAYKQSRDFDNIGLLTETCIVLVLHQGKMKHNAGTDYHERVNLPATVVAGATGSIVLGDLPDRDIHEDEDHQRVVAFRGRHIHDEILQIELRDGRAKALGKYIEIKQSETQQDTMAALEELLREQGWPTQQGVYVTYRDLAKLTGKHEKTIAGHFKAMKKDPEKMVWKQYRVVVTPSKGATLAAV